MSEEPRITPKFKKLVAQIIEGTAVPRSMGALGAAQEPWDELRGYLNLFGYSDSDEIESAIDRTLKEAEGHTA